MKKITISTLLFAAAFSIYAQDQKYVVFQDNFDWLLPWANALNANGKACGDAVEQTIQTQMKRSSVISTTLQLMLMALM